jgi:hypothetical protein
VAHLAAVLTGIVPERDASLARAIIAAHSRVPGSSRRLFSDRKRDLTNIIGYGKPDVATAIRSTESVLTLYARDSIANKTNHFYEMPVPDEFFTGSRRRRSISVALSHFAGVRSSRLEYKEQRLSFKLVSGNLDHVVAMFDADTADEEYENIPEVALSRTVGSRHRSRGTLQACSYSLTKPRDALSLILVVTRNDRAWSGSDETEAYALAVVVDDRLNADARLYAHARATAQVRIQLRG